MLFVFRKIIVGVVFVVLLVGLIALARGYRFSPTQREIKSTGILVVSSNPDGAKILVDGELRGATNSNIIVPPGEYNIEIKKDGFTSWSKKLKVKGELVIKADALLFPQNPTLSPVTSLGATRAFSSPSGDKIIIVSETGDEEKDGLYLLENVRNPLSRINPLKTLVLKTSFSEEPNGFSLSDILIEFSPDEEQFLLSFVDMPETATETDTRLIDYNKGTIRSVYLIDMGFLTEDPFTVTASVDTIQTAWQEKHSELIEKALKAYKKPLAEVALESFNIIAFAPDETRILYTATQSAILPLVIDPPLIATNQTPEIRDIEPEKIYVYDAEEDRNYLVFELGEFDGLDDARSSIQWYPSSSHLILKEEDKISALDYDGTNKRTVYSGPFTQDFLATSKDGRLFILTNFNSEIGDLHDIYSVGLK